MLAENMYVMDWAPFCQPTAAGVNGSTPMRRGPELGKNDRPAKLDARRVLSPDAKVSFQCFLVLRSSPCIRRYSSCRCKPAPW